MLNNISEKITSENNISQTNKAEEHHSKDDDLGTHWSGAEHLELGENGFSLACSEFVVSGFECPSSNLFRKDKKGNLTYGKVVALGDFYDSANKAYQEKRVIRGLERIFKCIDEQGKVHARQETHPHTEYPDCTWVNIFSGTKYLQILSTNIKHFGWYNIKEYIKVHQQALELALRAHRFAEENQFDKAEYYFNKSLFYNAYADHFLTDAFSAGHVRVPRKQVKEWAKKNVRGVLKSVVGDSLGNLLHEFDGRNRRGIHVGLPVQNSLGQEWVTHSDNNLHYNATADDPVIKIPTKAVSISVQEIFMAYKYGIAPDDVFQAINLVPFVTGEAMADKFALNNSERENKRWVRKLRNGLEWPLRMITSKRSITKMINSLDPIMQSMASDVRSDLIENDELHLRMPEAYKQNFSNID